ncbi:MAG: hypothetical protein KAZ17_03245 [Sphingorhabdus sp.]|nr:hypothetical protein [Sphingorhabdus sp.]
MLTKGDEYPIHQTAEPIAFSGTDRNFYDRFFFCGYRPDGSGYFGAAFGVYPHLNIVDAHFSVVRDGVQHCIHASRILGFERMDTHCGPIRIEVVEPLKIIRLIVENHDGISADLTFEGRSAPIQEPRFTRRNGARMFMDLTRFTVNCHVRGWVEIDGKREIYDGAFGTRDRSWGVRQIGAPDAQPVVPPVLPQFYWLWAPTNFPDLSLYAHVNEDQAGTAWNRRASLMMDGAEQDKAVHLQDDRFHIDWQPGKRHANSARLEMRDASGRKHLVTWEPIDLFMMKGIGYGHSEWTHGGFKGELAAEREDFRPADLDPLMIPHLHIQHVARAKHEGGGAASEGIGLLEQLVIGPHDPSGFKGINDGAGA